MVSSILRKRYVCAFSLLLALTITSAMAQDTQQTQRPMFAHPIPTFDNSAAAATALQTWNGTFTYQNKKNAFTMVGTDPSSTNVKTTIPVFIIPLKVVFTKGTTTKTFDPAHKLPSGKTVLQQTTSSPMFQSNVDWVQGGTDLGQTQYIDAYQRGNFWTDVMTNTNYHVVLGKPTIAPTITVNVPASQGTVGKSAFGPPELLGIISISWFMQQVPNWIAANPTITPSALPIFVTYNTYLSQTTNFGGCCIGGYHYAYGSASTPQTYAHFAFMDQSTTNQVFSSDVSALSHEVGEWMDDPYINNTQGACGGILENGDPLENTAAYGDFIQTVSGYDYHIQDLIFLKYFGQTPSTSVNDWWSFQNYPITSVCQFGQ